MKRTIHSVALLISVVLLFNTSCSKDGAAGASAAGAGGSLAKFALVGNYLYVISDPHAVSVYDISNPAKPVSKGNTYMGFDIETIFPYKDKLYLGASNGLYIASIATPDKPALLGSVTHFRACDPIVANDSVSYVTLRSAGSNCGSTKNVLNVYNSKDPYHPELKKEVAMQSPYGLGLSGRALYVCEAGNGLTIFDLTDPYNPAQVQRLTDAAYFDVIPYDKVLIAWTTTGVSFFDASDPLHISKAGEWKD